MLSELDTSSGVPLFQDEEWDHSDDEDGYPWDCDLGAVVELEDDT